MSPLLDAVMSNLPPGWDRLNHKSKMVQINQDDPEYLDIKAKCGYFVPMSILRIENPFMWGYYQLKKEFFQHWNVVKEKTMWHAVKESNIQLVADDNFNWQMSDRFKFGRGVCFTYDLERAMHRSKRGTVMIMAQVLVDRDSFPRLERDVYIEHNKNEFYPAYVLHL